MLMLSLSWGLGGGCTPLLDESSVTARLNEIVPTVATVTARTTAPAQVYVEYGRGLDYGLATPMSETAADTHEVDVIGLVPGATWHYRVVTVVGGREVAGEDHTIEAPPPPGGLPELEVLSDDGDAWGAWTLASFSWLEPDQPAGAFVLDDAAEITWYWAEATERVLWTELSQDGRSVVVLESSPIRDTPSRVSFVSLDGRSVEQVDVPLAHHAIAQVGTSGVRFAYIASLVEPWEGESVVGDRVVEVADDGTERELWNAFDRLEVRRHDGWDAPNPGGADWTHANGLSYDEESDAYYLSLFYLGMIVKIDRATGETVWIVGGDDSDFTFPDDGGFAHQHAPEVHGEMLYLFDNRSHGASRTVAYTLDTTAWTARRAWQWETPEQSHVGVLGDIDLLDDEQVLSAWGDLGQLAIVGVDGTLRRRVDAEPGVLLGKADRLETLYP